MDIFERFASPREPTPLPRGKGVRGDLGPRLRLPLGWCHWGRGAAGGAPPDRGVPPVLAQWEGALWAPLEKHLSLAFRGSASHPHFVPFIQKIPQTLSPVVGSLGV